MKGITFFVVHSQAIEFHFPRFERYSIWFCLPHPYNYLLVTHLTQDSSSCLIIVLGLRRASALMALIFVLGASRDMLQQAPHVLDIYIYI